MLASVRSKGCSTKLILRLALPNIISNITVPLLSLVDIALAGHMGQTSAIGAVAVAATITNTVYWLFGFLRLGTTGFVAQAYGRSDVQSICLHLGRGIVLCIVCTASILLLSPLFSQFASVIGNQQQIINQAQQYIQLVFLGAPAVLGCYILNGFFVGMQDTRAPMVASIVTNVINMVGSFLFVRYLQWGVVGLATGTVIAQYCNLLLLGYLGIRYHGRVLSFINRNHFCERKGYTLFLSVGRDLFFRSIMLSGVTLFFTYGGTNQGEITIAANTSLMQLFNLFSYFMDGFAYAGEALSGRYVGMHRPDLLRSLIRKLFSIGFFLALTASALYLLLPHYFLSLLSNQPQIVEKALSYRYWVAFIPLVGFAAFLWDGIYVGTTQSRRLMISMGIATLVFFVLYFVFVPYMGGDALWLAFDSYLLVRGVAQTLLHQPQFNTHRL